MIPKLPAWSILTVSAVVFYGVQLSAQNPIPMQKQDDISMEHSPQNLNSARPIRHVAVYQAHQLVLQAADEPGFLLSTASPAPGGGTSHPWINAQAMRAAAENELGTLLRAANSFDEYLLALVVHGFDIFSMEGGAAPTELQEGYRIYASNQLIGVVWNHPGQFMTLQQQPEEGDLYSAFASMTVYELGHAEPLQKAFATTDTFTALLNALHGQGLMTVVL